MWYLISRLPRFTDAVAGRIARLARAPDRGDSPVPSAVIIFGLVLVAIFVVGWLYVYVSDFMENAPDSSDIPEPPANE